MHNSFPTVYGVVLPVLLLHGAEAAPLAPGRPAGVASAQASTAGLGIIYVGAAGAIAAGALLAAAGDGNGSLASGTLIVTGSTTGQDGSGGTVTGGGRGAGFSGIGGNSSGSDGGGVTGGDKGQTFAGIGNKSNSGDADDFLSAGVVTYAYFGAGGTITNGGSISDVTIGTSNLNYLNGGSSSTTSTR